MSRLFIQFSLQFYDLCIDLSELTKFNRWQ